MTRTPRSQSIARRLRGFLAEEQIPAIRLASALGLTQSKLARRMTGQVAFSIDELDAICDALGIRFEWLTTGVGPVYDPDGGASCRDRTDDRSLTRSRDDQRVVTVDFGRHETDTSTGIAA